MEPVTKFAKDNWSDKAHLVLNSHSDWDHVWGNCAFAGALIIAHQKTYEFMADDGRWEYALCSWSEAKNGTVERSLPTLTFAKEINFPEDDLTFFHSPGHTVDSSTLWDSRDGVLFVGDNLELPLPYLQSHDFEAYINTLERYLELEPETIITSHSGIVPSSLITKTKEYLEFVASSFDDGQIPILENEEDGALALHQSNLFSLIVSRVEEKAKELWGEEFTTKRFIDFVEENKSDVVESLEAMLLAALV